MNVTPATPLPAPRRGSWIGIMSTRLSKAARWSFGVSQCKAIVLYEKRWLLLSVGGLV